MTETKIKIEGMMCGHCQATVTYDPKKTNVDAIKAAIVDAGYKA